MKAAIVHDWIVTLGGSEKVLKEIYNLYPSADIYTLFFKEETAQRLGIEPYKIKSSFLKKFPRINKSYRNYLLFFPLAVEQFDLSGYDLIISSSHAVAKGVITHSHQLHICYCYTPLRYAWDLYHQYLKASHFKGWKAKLAKLILHYIRIWDFTTVSRVDYFIAISNYIAKRIKRVYNRKSTVIYPPVDVDEFELCTKKDTFYLAASRMVPYKKLDVIVEAFSLMQDKKLVVIGDGPEFKKIKKKATRNVELLGYQYHDTLKKYLQKAKAFIFAAEEDFGILPVESQACGTPVIAYGKGGVREAVIEISEKSEFSPTGVFFKEQTPEALRKAVDYFEKNEDRFDYKKIRKNAERFSRKIFREKFKKFVDEKVKEFL